MRPSDQPEPSPRFGRVPPAPPVAPPATGEAPRPDPPSGNAPARIVGLGKLVGISSVGVVGAVWFAGVASVLSALLAGAAFALLAARSGFVARPVFRRARHRAAMHLPAPFFRAVGRWSVG